MLNERQRKLYELLVKMSTYTQKAYFTKEDICACMHKEYPRHLEKSSEHNSVAFAALRKDVRAINLSDEVEKIIISSKEGYKIGTREEAVQYLERRLKSSLVSLKLYWKLKKKAGANRQIDIEMNEIKTFIGDE